jgi:hypothetical protein
MAMPPAPIGPGAPAPAPHQHPIATANTPATLSLVFGIIAVLVNFLFIPSLVALITGIVGLSRASKLTPPIGRGKAIAGLILSVVGVISGILISMAMFSGLGEALDDTPEAVGSSTAQPDASAAPAEDDPADDPEEGTRENPFQVGDTVSNDDWTVTLGTPREGWDEIRAENQFNEPPADGNEYWIVPVNATYTGTETGTPWLDLTVAFVGSDNVTYDDTYCGVIPNDISETAELYTDGNVEANTCLVVPSGADGQFTLIAGLFGDPVFFNTK